jgi:hypothetical protein
LTAAAQNAFYTGQLERAAELGVWAIAEAERFTPALLLAVIVVGLLNAASGDPAGAMAVLAHGAKPVERDGPSEWLSCALLGSAAWFAIAVGDFDTARSEARQAVAAARLVRSPTLLAHALSAHARTLSEENPEEALAAAEEVIGLVEAGAANNSYTPALQSAALLRSRRGDRLGAAQAIHAAIEHESHTGNRLTFAADITVAVVVLADQPSGFEAAATLAGACRGPVLGHLPAFLGAPHRDRYDQVLADLADTLGDEANAKAQHDGAAMTYDEIVHFTLAHLASVGNTSATSGAPTG